MNVHEGFSSPDQRWMFECPPWLPSSVRDSSSPTSLALCSSWFSYLRGEIVGLTFLFG